VVIGASVRKKEFSDGLINIRYSSENLSDVTILSEGKRFIWNVSLFDSMQNKLTGIVIIERDSAGGFISRINAQSAEWNGAYWQLRSVRKFFWNAGDLTESVYAIVDDDDLKEPPESFKGRGKSSEAMTLAESWASMKILKNNGLPSSSIEAEFYKRFAFALTPFMVLLMAGVLAGKFKKNVLLMSLLISLIAATVYFVIQMVSMILAKTDALPPFLGGFLPIIIYCLLILLGFKIKRS